MGRKIMPGYIPQPRRDPKLPFRNLRRKHVTESIKGFRPAGWGVIKPGLERVISSDTSLIGKASAVVVGGLMLSAGLAGCLGKTDEGYKGPEPRINYVSVDAYINYYKGKPLNKWATLYLDVDRTANLTGLVADIYSNLDLSKIPPEHLDKLKKEPGIILEPKGNDLSYRVAEPYTPSGEPDHGDFSNKTILAKVRLDGTWGAGYLFPGEYRMNVAVSDEEGRVSPGKNITFDAPNAPPYFLKIEFGDEYGERKDQGIEFPDNESVKFTFISRDIDSLFTYNYTLNVLNDDWKYEEVASGRSNELNRAVTRTERVKDDRNVYWVHVEAQDIVGGDVGVTNFCASRQNGKFTPCP